MFLDFTLTKDGAFVFCEDAAEYDANIPESENPKAEEIQTDLVDSRGPGMVKKIQIKTLPIYERLNELTRMVNGTSESSQDTLSCINELRSYASYMFSDLRNLIGSIYGIRGSVNSKWTLLPIIYDMKKFVQNQTLIERSRYNTIKMEFPHSKLPNDLDIAGAINGLIVNSRQPLDYSLESLNYSNKASFNSWAQLLEEFYASEIPEEDPLFTETDINSREFKYVIIDSHIIMNKTYIRDWCQEDGFSSHEGFAELMNFNSIMERRTMIDIHDCYNEYLENESVNVKDLVAVVIQMYNTFIINLMYAIGCAYEIEYYRHSYIVNKEYASLWLNVIDDAKLG